MRQDLNEVPARREDQGELQDEGVMMTFRLTCQFYPNSQHSPNGMSIQPAGLEIRFQKRRRCTYRNSPDND